MGGAGRTAVTGESAGPRWCHVRNACPRRGPHPPLPAGARPRRSRPHIPAGIDAVAHDTLRHVAAQLADGQLLVDAGADSTEVLPLWTWIPGIGAAAVAYVAMRGFDQPDAFMPGDPGPVLLCAISAMRTIDSRSRPCNSARRVLAGIRRASPRDEPGQRGPEPRCLRSRARRPRAPPPCERIGVVAQIPPFGRWRRRRGAGSVAA